MALGDIFTGAAGATADLFAAKGYRAKATGNRIEAQEYDLASHLASKNEEYTRQSTEIKEMQTQRGVMQALGQQRADVAGSGFAASGSALDLLRDSAAQGTLTRSILAKQGMIDEQGYEEQSKSYDLMASSARVAAGAADEAAKGAEVTAGLKAAAGVTSGIGDVISTVAKVGAFLFL